MNLICISEIFQTVVVYTCILVMFKRFILCTVIIQVKGRHLPEIISKRLNLSYKMDLDFGNFEKHHIRAREIDKCQSVRLFSK